MLRKDIQHYHGGNHQNGEDHPNSIRKALVHAHEFIPALLMGTTFGVAIEAASLRAGESQCLGDSRPPELRHIRRAKFQDSCTSGMATAMTGPVRRSRPASGPRGSKAAREPSLPNGPASGRAIDPIDFHVGNQLRTARKAMGLTQEELAAQLGITFQQLQKYEKGANRISASRLHYAGQVLNVPLSYFFPEPDPAPGTGRAANPVIAAMRFHVTTESLELNRAFSEIEDAALRRQLLELVRGLAKAG